MEHSALRVFPRLFFFTAFHLPTDVGEKRAKAELARLLANVGRGVRFNQNSEIITKKYENLENFRVFRYFRASPKNCLFNAATGRGKCDTRKIFFPSRTWLLRYKEQLCEIYMSTFLDVFKYLSGASSSSRAPQNDIEKRNTLCRCARGEEEDERQKFFAPLI